MRSGPDAGAIHNGMNGRVSDTASGSSMRRLEVPERRSSWRCRTRCDGLGTLDSITDRAPCCWWPRSRLPGGRRPPRRSGANGAVVGQGVPRPRPRGTRGQRAQRPTPSPIGRAAGRGRRRYSTAAGALRPQQQHLGRPHALGAHARDLRHRARRGTIHDIMPRCSRIGSRR